tara:strand:+ start:640 stop:1503 length:864 start_codon:yes stop_codon:yes gene_type:complete
MIKYIHCFGTSFTAGGGHEFDAITPSRNIDSSYNKQLIYHYSTKFPNEELTRFNCSWPGQLQKLFGKDIKVNNLAESGYGNDRLCRLTWEIISEGDFNPKEHLFLFEFAGLGRKELWSNSLNDYIVTNYNMGYDDKTFEYNGSANKYYYDNDKLQRKLDSLSDDIIEPFYKEFLGVKSEMNKLEMETGFFISHLKQNNINFMFTQEPFIGITLAEEKKKYLFEFGNTYNFVSFFNDNFLTIKNDTNGDCDDGHMGMKGAKMVSKIIYNKLVELKYTPSYMLISRDLI